MTRPRKVLPGVGLLSAEELRVAKKSFGYRWREEKRKQKTPGYDAGIPIFGNDTWITEARDWWLVAFAHAIEYARVQRAKEMFP